VNILLIKRWLSEEGTRLIGARLRRVRQLDPRALVLEFDSDFGALHLLMSMLEECPVIGLLEDGELSDESVPDGNFVKALNFHLPGYRIVSIQQDGYDRSIRFTFRNRDVYGAETQKELRHELAGRAANAFLISERSMLVSIFKKLRYEASRPRNISTGQPLPEPPPLGKFVASEGGIAGLADELAEIAESEGVHGQRALERLFTNRTACADNRTWPAIEPLLPVNYSLESLLEFIARLQRGELTGSLFGLTAPGDANRVGIENWQTARARRGLRREQASPELEQAQRLLDNLREQSRQSARADEYELLALELLRISSDHAEPEDEARLLRQWREDHPELAGQITIGKSVYDNAQELVNWCQRLRRAGTRLQERIGQAEAELSDLQQRPRVKVDRKKPAVKSPLETNSGKLEKHGVKFLRYLSSDGMDILCGMSDASNDGLIRIFGNARHMWFHVRDFPGSHVIVLSNGKELPWSTLEEAALVAGWHSKARNELEVDVSYLPMSQLSRPKNAKPGQVLKKSENVISIRPDRLLAIRDHLMRWEKW
jgi:predicted ribosome quality control (RQC) complex YloA/Tae2 family protein